MTFIHNTSLNVNFLKSDQESDLAKKVSVS